MDNFRLSMSKVDGSQTDFNDCETGRELIAELLGDDFGAPPKHLCIEADIADGKTVRIYVPYSESRKVTVKIEDSEQ